MKLNLQKIVQSLIEIGLNQREIATEVGCSQPTVSHIYHNVWGNQQPNYKTATSFVRFAAKHGIREDGSKDSKVHKRGSWKAMPPPPSKNKVLSEERK